MKTKTLVLKLFMVLLLLTPFVAAAQANPCIGGRDTNLGQCVSQVYLWSLGISGLLAVSVCVWGGYLVMTARGNGAQAANGKSYIYSAIAGMILLLGAYVLLNTINPDLADFDVPNINEALPVNPPNPAGGTGDTAIPPQQ